MKTSKQSGIWMDYSKALIITSEDESPDTKIIESKPENADDEQYEFPRDESHQLNKEKMQLSAYYRKISDIILQCNEVLLFGPTDAKKELYNLLKEDSHFSHIQIVVQSGDKMTDNQLHAYVKEYFHSKKMIHPEG
ncbi:MAG: hypothetical protein FD155_180 [Bacteroidetes bacterium]|nr:MAG: hypothetical protein FD155_180 [Bacteroidota bacterium]